MKSGHSAPHQNLFEMGAGGDVVDHVRAQVPLLRASVAATSNSSEQMIRVKLLEQENERYVRKIKGLEAQLSELEKVSSYCQSPLSAVVIREAIGAFSCSSVCIHQRGLCVMC